MNALPDWFWISLLALGAVVLVGASVYAARYSTKGFSRSRCRTGSHRAKEDETHFKAREQEIQSLLEGE